MKEIAELTTEKRRSQLHQDSVYEAIRKAILRGEYCPGQKLVERKIAEHLGVSRTPVREALRKLELEGLVEHIPGKGVIVAKLSPREVWEIYNIRAVLEGLAARFAAQNVTPEQLAHLEEIVREMEEAVETRDSEKLSGLHMKFHEAIYEAAGSARLQSMLSSLVDYIMAFTRVGYAVPGRVREATEEHREIFEAIKRNSPQEAEQLSREHVERSCDAYFVHLALSGEQEMEQ